MMNGLRSATLVAVSVLLGACTVQPMHDHYGDQLVYLAPPPVQYEHVGHPPMIDAVWIAGYWSWGGGRYVWVPGRWEAPRPGHRWMPHRWEQDGNHWRQHGGRWEREAQAQPQPRPAPPPRGDRPDNKPRMEYRPASQPDPGRSAGAERNPPPRAKPDDPRHPEPGPFRSRRDNHDRDDRQ